MMRILAEIGVTLSASAAISLIVKGTAAVALGLISAWLARRGRAAVRHAVLASAFGVLLALPLVSVIATPVTIRVPVAASGGVVPSFDSNSLSSRGETASARQAPAPGKSRWSLPSLAATPLSTLLFCGWLTGVSIFVIRFIIGLLQVRSLRRCGLPWRHGQAVAERLAPRARRGVEVLLHESLSAPMTCGVLRPVVMLPEDVQNWGEKDLERALVHELEHVRRYDWVIHCFARVACAAYWFHPLVWAAWRQLTLEAERSCDDAVLGNSEAIAYADQLLGLARRRSTVKRSPALAMANRSDLAARIGALLDRRQSRGPVGVLPISACVVAVAIVLTMSPLRVVATPQSSTPGAVQSVPKWDAVSIRRCTNAPPAARLNDRGAGAAQSPDRLTMNCVPVSTLINVAYTLNAGGQDAPPGYPVPIERLPSWAGSERYTIEAKSRESVAAGIMRGPMLQTLLEDRFALKIHRETREGRAYMVTVAKGGLKLQPFDGECTPVDFAHTAPAPTPTPPPNRCLENRHSNGPNITIDIPGMDLDSFLWYLGAFNGSARFDGPVLNKTGLTGYFHFHLEFQDPDATASDDAPFPPIITAMEQQLGLKVEAGKGPHKYLVVDHLQRPSPN
jgi:uncharacterized protein (TIGR03435 family)